jgi:hypothetical protein
MKVYIGANNGIPLCRAYTSLQGICKELGVPYNSAVKGKLMWIDGGVIKAITKAEIVKIKGRGNKNMK